MAIDIYIIAKMSHWLCHSYISRYDMEVIGINTRNN